MAALKKLPARSASGEADFEEHRPARSASGEADFAPRAPKFHGERGPEKLRPAGSASGEADFAAQAPKPYCGRGLEELPPARSASGKADFAARAPKSYFCCVPENLRPARIASGEADSFARAKTLNPAAAAAAAIIGHDEEIRSLITILSKRRRNNPLLISDPAAAHKAAQIVQTLAIRIARSDGGGVPADLRGARVVALDALRTEAIEPQLKSALLREAPAAEIILFVDNVHLLLAAGGARSAAALVLRSALAGGRIRCIGATTTEDYRTFVAEKDDAALDRRFQKVFVKETSVADTILVLRGLKAEYEAQYGVRIRDRALVEAAELASRRIKGGHLLDKAIDLLDEACANVRVQLDSRPEELHNLESKRIRLQLELQSLEGEKDKASRARAVEVRKELDESRDELSPMLAKYREEKERIDEIGRLVRRRVGLLFELGEAERRRDSPGAAYLRHEALPEIDAAVAKLEGESDGNVMLTDAVGPEHIAEVLEDQFL